MSRGRSRGRSEAQLRAAKTRRDAEVEAIKAKAVSTANTLLNDRAVPSETRRRYALGTITVAASKVVRLEQSPL